MTNKFYSLIDGIRIRVASVMHRCCHRSDSVSFVSRQSDLRTLLLCLILFIGVGQMWAKEGDVLKTYNTNSSTFSTGYARQSGDNFIWYGQKNYLGANNATTHGNIKPTAADLPVVKAQNASATTNTTGYYYCYTSEAVANVGALEIYLSAKSGSSTANVYVVSSSTAASSGSATWTKVTLSASSANAQGKNVNSSGTYRFTFNATETGSKYYGIVIATSSYWRATGFTMKLIEGATSSKTLSSIEVKTAPKVKYVAGENFDPSGLKITATYSDASKEDISYAAATFTLSPTTSTALTTSHTSVSITYGGKSTSQAINVYNVTMQTRDEDGNTIPSGGPGDPSRTGKSITPANDANNYVFKEWQVTNAELGSSASTKVNTITNPDDAVTVTAVYYKPITITYKANGQDFTTQTYGYGGTLAFPASEPDGDDYSCTGKTFTGWVAEANKDYKHASTAPTYATAGGPVTTAANYYAVFADASGTPESWTKVTSAPSNWSGEYVITNAGGANAMISDFYSGTSGEFSSASVTISNSQITSTPTNKMIWIVEKNGNNAQYSFKNKSTGTYASITGTGSTAAALSNSAVWFTIAISSGTCTISSVSYSSKAFAWYSSRSTFRTYANTGNTYCNLYKKSGGTTYSNYETSCCTPLGSINGSFNRYHLKIFHHIIMSMFTRSFLSAKRGTVS